MWTIRPIIGWPCWLIFFCSALKAPAQTTLVPGDLAIVGVATNVGDDLSVSCETGASSGRDRIYFVCFKDIATGTVLDFTDNGWERRFVGKWGNAEGFLRMVRTGPNISAGTTIALELPANPNAGLPLAVSPDNGWTFNLIGNLNLDAGGDQLFVLQGGNWDNGTACPGTCNQDATYMGGSLLYAFSNNGWSNQPTGTADNPNQSKLPPQILPCLSVNVSGEFVSYKMPINIGSAPSWANRIRTTTNWGIYPDCASFLPPPAKFNIVPYTARLDCIGNCTGCTALTSFFRVNLSLPLSWGPFTLTYTDGNKTYVLNNVTDGQAVSHTAAVNTTYRIISLVAANGCAVPFTYEGNGSVTVFPRPVFQSVQRPVCTSLPVNLLDLPYVGTNIANTTLSFHTSPNPAASNLLPNPIVNINGPTLIYGLAIDNRGCRDTFPIALDAGGFVSAGTPKDSAFCQRNKGPNLFLSNLLYGETTGGAWTVEPGSADPGAYFNPLTNALNPANLPGGKYVFRYDISAPNCGSDSKTVMVDIYTPDTTRIEAFTCDPAQTDTQTLRLSGFRGCDSVIVTQKTYLPPDSTRIKAFTCDPAQAGTQILRLSGFRGCDSVIVTQKTYVSPDSTRIEAFTCDPAQAGTQILRLNGFRGCDSVIVTQKTYLPPTSTLFFKTTCNPSEAGTKLIRLTGFKGCDSLVITATTLLPSDTMYLIKKTCDPAQAGVVTARYGKFNGCDSLIITTTLLLPPDTTQLFLSACDPSAAGQEIKKLTNALGCDSVVLVNTRFVPPDSTFLVSSSCNSANVGLHIDYFKNSRGCDSTVFTTVTYLPPDSTFFYETTCDPLQAGIRLQGLINQEGCDSLIVTKISLLPPITTYKDGITCDPNGGIRADTYPAANGCDSTVVTTFYYRAPDTTYLAGFVCDSAAAGLQVRHLKNRFGCDSLTYTLYQTLPTPSSHLSVRLCADESVVVNGIAYDLNHPAGTERLKGAAANGCDSLVHIQLFFSYLDVRTSSHPPSCPEVKDGYISIDSILNGTPPYEFSLDGHFFRALPLPYDIGQLKSGPHPLFVRDVRHCPFADTLQLPATPDLLLDLGGTRQLSLGQTLELTINSNFQPRSIVWTADSSLSCLNCPNPVVSPLHTTRYRVIATDSTGCSIENSVLVTVKRENDFYVPNVFSPNGDGQNDVLTIYCGPSVAQVRKFGLFDRWGGSVLSLERLLPDDRRLSWDGSLAGRPLPPGVFVYAAELEYIDGTVALWSGDVTLIR